jgi:carbon-monoxide dehydrogenase large subunit
MTGKLTGKVIGKATSRLEDVPLLTGTACFVDDLIYPGMLHAAFVRSAHAHATIRKVDTNSAKSKPGVIAVFTFADIRPFLRGDRLVVALPSKTFRQKLDRPVLAIDEVTYVGEPIAIVIAESRAQAEDALADVEIEYEPLDAVVDCALALNDDAPRAHRGAPDNIVAEFDLRFGDVESAFRSAPHVFSQTFHQTRGGSHSIECRGNLAIYDPVGDYLTVWSSTQTPHAAMRLLAEMLGREENSIRVVMPEVGGGFGPKLVFYSEELVIALASILLRRPVKWIEDRREHFIATTQERDQIWSLDIAVDTDGRILGIRGSMIHDHGAYTARGINVAFEAVQTLTMPYNVPACAIDAKIVATNKVPVTPVRGAGQPQGVFAMERMLDLVARELGVDRATLRRRNLVQSDQIPCAKPFRTRSGIPVVIDSGNLPECQGKALGAACWDGFEERKRADRSRGRHIGIGIANFVELTGRGPFEPATVRVTASGKVHVLSSAAHMGQGTKTMLAQIVAEQLGGDLSNIMVTTGDSASSTLGFGGFGSRQTVTAGSSAYVAACKVRKKALEIAGHLLETSADDLDVAGSDVHVKGAKELKVTLADCAKAAVGVAGAILPGGLPPGLEATESFLINEMAYSNGTAVATVEVDVETGMVVILDLVIAHDCGRVINPTLVEGQLVGGVVHGIGNSLFERMHFDAAGQPLTTNLAEYLLPTATEVPTIRVLHTESPSPLNPLGVKGVGESGVLPTAAAVIGAIEHALSEFQVRICSVPVAPADIVALLEQAKADRLDVGL